MPRVGGLDVLRAMRAEGPGEGTVKIHLHHAYGKLQVETRVGLAVRLRENRLA